MFIWGLSETLHYTQQLLINNSVINKGKKNLIFNLLLVTTMKTIEDLKRVGLELEKKYNVTFELEEKPYPESIIPTAKIVDSMWLFIYVNDWRLTSGRLDANCKDDIFELHIEDLENQIKEIKFGIKTKEETELPF